MYTAVQDWRDAMSEAAGRVVQDDLDRRNRFISENLRRVFLMIYRIVGNVADATLKATLPASVAVAARWA